MDHLTTIGPEGVSAPAGDRIADPAVARRRPFASRFQAVLVIVMLVCFMLIGQQWSKSIYQVGLPLLVLASFLQIAFGNISPAAGLKRSLTILTLTWLIVAAFFVLAITIAPRLIALGR